MMNMAFRALVLVAGAPTERRDSV